MKNYYGPALSYTISTCLGTGADITMVSAPGQPHPGYNNDKLDNFGGESEGESEGEDGSDVDVDTTNELLRIREADYLEGREYLHEVPGLDLRQESAPPAPTQQPQPTTVWATPPCAMTRTATMLYTTTATVAYVPSPPVRSYGLSDINRSGNGNGSNPDAAAVSDAAIAAATSPALYSRPWLVRTSVATPRARPPFPMSLSLSLFLFALLAATACTGLVIWILLAVVEGGEYVVS
ncbi:Protein cms1 [Diatrype stigma]|uniref:Protein cms1 n=1 Tax=Diatrype stigma TaxID=117547 RepID=A0AAN9UW56_9PEZI